MTFEEHRNFEGRRLDFTVEARNESLVFEVYDPHLRLPNRVGSFDGIGGLKKALIGRKRAQMMAVHRAALPYVGVVSSVDRAVPADPLQMAGAMFGQPQWVIPIDEHGAAVRDRAEFTAGDGGALTGKARDAVSAIALIHTFNPTQRRWDQRAHAIARRGGPNAWKKGRREARQMFEAFAAASEEMMLSGSFDPDARLARLDFLHNPDADIPLPREFAGPHDRQWDLIDGAYVLVAEGARAFELPTREREGDAE
jgi:hypothetical protein